MSESLDQPLFPPEQSLDALFDQMVAAQTAAETAAAHYATLQDQFETAHASYMDSLDLDWALSLEAFTPYGVHNSWGFAALQRWNRMDDGGESHRIFFYGDMSPVTKQFLFTIALPATASTHQLKITGDGVKHLCNFIRPGGFTDQPDTAQWKIFAIRDNAADVRSPYYLARQADDTWVVCQETNAHPEQADFHGHLDDALVFIRSRLPS